MSRPSKEELKQRENIKELGLFARDSKPYVICEDTIKKYSKTQAPYIFCGLCRVRSSKYKTGGNDYNKNNCLDRIKNIDLKLYRYYIRILDAEHILSFLDEHREYEGDYSIDTTIEIKMMVNVLGEVKTKKIINSTYEFFRDTNKTVELETIVKNISDEDKQTLLSYLHDKDDISIPTVIKSNKRWDRTSNLKNDQLEKESLITSNVQVELDFTKPKEELLEYISMIKDNFDNSPKSIQNIYGLLSNKENYLCDLNQCDIYKSNNIKPIGGRLADILFIYDCRKAGLDNDYILDEINKHWTETQNLFKDKMQLKTLREYHSLAIDYIDNEKYKCYLSGYDTPKEK